MRNNLTVIRNGAFDGLNKLLWLILRKNNLMLIEMLALKDLISLEWM